MNKAPALTRLSDFLRPFGFSRSGSVWNRTVCAFVDAIDAQISKDGEDLTINAGVLDEQVFKICWGRKPGESPEAAYCTVFARAGELIDGRDRWWPLSSDAALDDALDVIERGVLPFLDSMHSTAAMEKFLAIRDVARQAYPLPAINLAILQYRNGNESSGRDLLAAIKERTSGAWRHRVDEVVARLESGS